MQVLICVHLLVSRAYSHLRRAALIELLESGFGGLATVITATHHTTFYLEEWHDIAELLHAEVVALSEIIIRGSSSGFSTTIALQLTITVEEFWLPILDALNLAFTNAC